MPETVPGLRLILASTSPWRRALCAQVGLEIDAVAPLVNEEAIGAADPVSLAFARARAKAESLAGPGVVVIGSDQVCHLDGVVYGKPGSDEVHRDQLRSLRGKTHALTDAVSIIGPRFRVDFAVDAFVTLRRDISDAELDEYVASGDARGCAGGYRAEGPGAWLVEGIVGDWFTVVGLPIYRVLAELRALGWRPAAARNTRGLPPNGSSA